MEISLLCDARSHSASQRDELLHLLHRIILSYSVIDVFTISGSSSQLPWTQSLLTLAHSKPLMCGLTTTLLLPTNESPLIPPHVETSPLPPLPKMKGENSDFRNDTCQNNGWQGLANQVY